MSETLPLNQTPQPAAKVKLTQRTCHCLGKRPTWGDIGAGAGAGANAAAACRLAQPALLSPQAQAVAADPLQGGKGCWVGG